MTDEYRIQTSPNSVDFWSNRRLPLQPKGILSAARDELRQKIKSLEPLPGYGLWATLITECDDRFDAENVLFYNVGASNFGVLSGEGYSFNFGRRAPFEAGQFKYHHHYELRRLPTMASFRPQLQFVLDKLNTGIKPHSVWLRARFSEGIDIAPINGDFRLEIVITGPKVKCGIAAFAKPLLDGVIAALHFDARVDQSALAVLSSKFQMSADLLLAEFSRTSRSPLGDRQVISTYRGPTSIKWNPEDERCVECSIRWLPGSGPVTRVDVQIQPANG